MNANTPLNAVMELDLEPIKTKLMHVASGEGWSRDKADAVEKEYRRFLCLMKLYPDEATAPLADVDTFWHYHILDTMKYARDCEQAFGYFLHHYPYVGMRGGDDAQFRLDSGERMRTLYEATFGDAYPAMHADDVQDTAFCGGPVPNDKAALAFCGGPVPNDRAALAFCGGPVPNGDKGIALAFCGGPVPNGSKGIALAFCGGPVPNGKQAQALAFCGGPVPNQGKRPSLAFGAGQSVQGMRVESGAIVWQTGA